MKQNIETALDQCLGWLRGGLDVATCLERVPELADELRPLLEAAADLRRVTVPSPSAEARAAGQERMLAALRKKRTASRGVVLASRIVRELRHALAWTRLRPAWQMAVVLLVVLFVLGSGVTVAASANSLPGDALYPLKLAGQRAQLALTFNPAHRQQFEEDLRGERLEDVKTVLAAGRRTNVDFEGELEEIQDGIWLVDGLPATVQGATAIVGHPYLGARVRVRGFLPGDGQVLVTELEVEEQEQPASKPAQTPRPSETRRPATPGGTEELTETVEPGITPEPTRQAEPTQAMEPTERLQPTQTIEPSEAPHPTETMEPGETPHLTETMEPGETPHPTETLEPDQTPEPTEMDELTEHLEHATTTPEARPTHER